MFIAQVLETGYDILVGDGTWHDILKRCLRAGSKIRIVMAGRADPACLNDERYIVWRYRERMEKRLMNHPGCNNERKITHGCGDGNWGRSLWRSYGGWRKD